MKRILTSILLILVIALSLTSCDLIKDKLGDPVFNQLNELIKAEHNDYTISISLKDKNSHTLNETYVATTAENGNTTITYTVERLNKFNVNGSNVTIPGSYKKVLTGYAVINGENLFEQEGDDIGVDFLKVTIPAFNFNDKAIENAIVADGKLTADVIDQTKFFGYELTTEPMQVEVEFNEEAISEITLTFKTAEGSDAVVVYTFN